MEEEKLKGKKLLLEQVITDQSYHPMKLREMAAFLQVPKSERDDLKMVLDALIHDGKIIMDQNARYKAANGNIKVGIFSGTTRGFGFVKIEGEEDLGDIFIPESETKGAVNKDKVQIMVSEESTGKRREGVVLSVLERNITELVGTFQKSKNFGFVIPDNNKFGSDIFIPKEKTKGAVNGHKVLVEITNYKTADKKPEGKIIQIIGHINDPGVDVMSVS